MVKVYACCKCNVSVYNLMEYKKKCINNPSFYYLSKNFIQMSFCQMSFPRETWPGSLSGKCDYFAVSQYLSLITEL